MSEPHGFRRFVRVMWSGLRGRSGGAVAALLDTALELAVRLLLLTAVFLMEVLLEPYVRYVPYNDLVTKYKRPRRPSIFPVWAVVIVVIIIPVLIISTPALVADNDVDTTQGFLAWSLALSINAFITETTKLIVGRPRPDFFYRCFPNGVVTKDLRCTGDPRVVTEGRKSFPSGHSSFSFCSLGFVSVWLCGKLGVMSRARGRGAGVAGCALPLLLAAVVAASRCCDHHHHWEDVLAGSLVGFLTSYLIYHQYYHQLDSPQSGIPLVSKEEFSDDDNSIVSECCTKHLNENSYTKLKTKCKTY